MTLTSTMTKACTAAVGAAVLGLTVAGMPASAATPFSTGATGVDGSGNLLAPGAEDANWEVFDISGKSLGNAFVVSPPSGIPGTWISNGPTSQWIAEDPDGIDGVNETRVYQTTFEGFFGAIVQGRVAADNFILDILLNGVSTGLSFGNPPPAPITVANSAFDQFFDFTITGVIDGTNTLGFVVQDVGVITGFRTEYEVIPTPALLPGLIGVGVAALRRRKDETAEENA